MRALPLEYACGLRFGVYAGLSRSYSAVRWGPRGGVMAAANKDPEINAKQARRDQSVQHQGRQNANPRATSCARFARPQLDPRPRHLSFLPRQI